MLGKNLFCSISFAIPPPVDPLIKFFFLNKNAREKRGEPIEVVWVSKFSEENDEGGEVSSYPINHHSEQEHKSKHNKKLNSGDLHNCGNTTEATTLLQRFIKLHK